jgi:hypothetical protein
MRVRVCCCGDGGDGTGGGGLSRSSRAPGPHGGARFIAHALPASSTGALLLSFSSCIFFMIPARHLYAYVHLVRIFIFTLVSHASFDAPFSVLTFINSLHHTFFLSLSLFLLPLS